MIEKIELMEPGAPCWLRPCEAEDGQGIFEAAMESRERVGKWMGWLTDAYKLSDAIEWAEAASADWSEGRRYEFVIVDAVSRGICGCCGLNRINRIDLVCNLGYWVRESHTRRGFATTAGRLLMV